MSNSQNGTRIENGKHIAWVWSVLETVGCVALLIVFNLFPEKIGVLVSATDPSSFIPFLAPWFDTHMPWLNLWWGLTLALAVAKLTYGHWTPVMRWADWAINLVGIIILIRLLVSGPILWSDRSDGWIIPVMDIAVKVGLAAYGIGLLVSVVKKLVATAHAAVSQRS